MRVRWTTTAADDLAHIVDYIRKDNPAAARRVAQTIYQGIASLRKSPGAGRIGLAEKHPRAGLFPLALYRGLRNHPRPGAGASYPPRRAGLAVTAMRSKGLRRGPSSASGTVPSPTSRMILIACG